MGLLSTIGAASGRSFGLTRVAAAIKDAYFNLTTLLLPGNGTNGAQNNTFLDSSTNNFTITRNGNTTQGTFSPFSQTGWSNYFGGSDYLSVPNNAALDLGTGDYTIEGWWYFADTSNQALISKYSSGQGFVVQYQANNLRMVLGLGGGSDAVYTFSWTPSANTWYHIAITRSGTSGRAFINGTQIGSTTTFTTSNTTSTTTLQIGLTHTTSEYTRGYASNIRLTKGGALYTGNFTPSTTPLTTTVSAGTVSLLTCQSNRFIDNSTNAFTITTSGTPSVQAFSPFAPTAAYSSSVVGGSGYFDGNGDYLTTPVNAALAFGSFDFCLEFWIYPTSFPSTDGRPLGNATSWGANAWSIHNDHGSHNEKFSFWVNNYNASTAMLVSTSSTRLNSWQHVAITRNGSTWRMFVNGAIEATQTSSVSIDGGSSDDLLIGGSGAANEYIGGYLAGLRAVKGSAVYTSAFTPPTAPPTAITNTSILLNFTNAGITDATAKNDLETVGNAQISTTQSKFGGSSMYFDGTGDWLLSHNPNNISAIGSGDFTIEAWIYPTSTTTGGITDFRTSSGDTSGFYFGIASGTLQIYSQGVINLTGGTISANTWTYVAARRSGSTINLYVNGSSVASTTNSTNWSRDSLTIGAGTRGGGDPFTGYIDDLRITKGYARTITTPTTAFPLQ